MPGTSGVLSPFAKIKGLYFDPTEEPCDFYYQLLKDLEKKYSDEGKVFIRVEYDNPSDFYKGLKSIQKYIDQNIQISGTSREGIYEMVINEFSDMDDQTKPSTVALSKNKKKKVSDEEIPEEIDEEDIEEDSDIESEDSFEE